MNNSTLNLTSQSSRLFFGEEGHGLARYDVVRHPVFLTLNEKMKSLYWDPKEVDLSNEKSSFNSMTDAEQFVFTSNLQRQILLDSIQGRSPALVFLPHCTDSSLENCVLTWGFQESVHSESYTHIIRAIYPDPSVVFDNIPGIKQIADCSAAITSAYDRMIKNPSKENLYLALIAANALEALRFFVSFSCTFSFGERGRVEGSAKEVKLIARDENCLHPNTEVLTSLGWKKILEVTTEDLIAQLDTDTSNISFSKPTKVIEKDYGGTMFKLKYKHSGKILQNITSDHDVLLNTFSNKNKTFSGIRKEVASKVKCNVANYFPVSGVIPGSKILTDLEKFQIAFQADGSNSDRYTGETSETAPAWFSLTKSRKIARLTELLGSLGFTYSETKRKGAHYFVVNVPKEVSLCKNFSWVDLPSIDTNWARGFMSELVEWDGHRPSDADYLYYSNTRPGAISVIQSVLALTGYKHRRGIQIDDRKETYKDIHRIYWWPINNDTGRIPSQNLMLEPYAYTGKVGCVTMPLGTIITRYAGNVCVTGNCHLALVQHILKRLPKDDPEFIQIIGDLRPQAIQMFDETADQEKAWAPYIFQHGPIMGLNEGIVVDYIDHLLPRRKAAAGLTTTTKFEKENPIPWINKWLSDANYQPAPQEVEGTGYLTASLKNDVSELEFTL